MTEYFPFLGTPKSPNTFPIYFFELFPLSYNTNAFDSIYII